MKIMKKQTYRKALPIKSFITFLISIMKIQGFRCLFLTKFASPKK